MCKRKCLKLIKRMDGVLLNMLETQDVFNFHDDEVWKKHPHPATAADFLKTNALTKFSGCYICIGNKDDKFIIFKNINDQSTVGWTGTIIELYQFLKTKKKWIKRKRILNPMEMIKRIINRKNNYYTYK